MDAEDVSEVSLEFEVAAVPTILFCTQGKIVERVEGAKVADVTKKVSKEKKLVLTHVTNPTESLASVSGRVYFFIQIHV